MKKRELILIAILTVLIAFMDISGIPSVLFFNIRIGDIEPMYFSLGIPFVITKYFCGNKSVFAKP